MNRYFKMSRYFTMMLGIFLAGACALQAQNVTPIVEEAKQAYNRIKDYHLRMAEKVPAEYYDFQPVPEIRTFGQLVAHVADAKARTCAALLGQENQIDAGSKSTKADLIAVLKETFVLCDAAYEALTPANLTEKIQMGRREATRLGALTGSTIHDNHEYGYMAVYLRLKGIVPPSSER